MLLPSYKQNIKKTDFYERDKYIEIFNEELKNVEKENINLIMFYGIGGIGKTTLLKHLFENYTENNIKIFINLEDYSNPLNFYSKLILELHKENIKLFNFKIAFAIYWNKLNPNLAMKENEAFKGEWETIIPIIDEIGFGVGSIFKALYDYKDEFKNKFLNNYKTELEELENLNYKEIEILLPKFLNYDLNNNMKNRNEKIVFFLDTHEYLFEINKKENNKLKCDTFLRDIILSTYEFKTLFVFSGREKLIWNKENEDWDSYIKHIELNAISKEVSKEYLKDNGIKEEEIINHIISYTDCVPFYLNLELNIYLKLDNPTISDFNGAKTKKDIFNRFMLYADNNELQLLKVLSFTKKFNLNLFEEIIKKFNIPVSILMFDDFINNSYVTQLDEENFSLHNLMKISIKDSVNQILKNKINEFLFNFYENNIEEQINYALEIYDVIELNKYIKSKLKNISNNIFLLTKLYNITLDYYNNYIINKIKVEDYCDEVYEYLYLYIDLGLMYIKSNNILEFNILNKKYFEGLKLNKKISNLKNYLFLQKILSKSSDYHKTINFIEKIDIDDLPNDYKYDLKIDLANFYRKNNKLNLSKKYLEMIEKDFNYLSNENKYQFFMKKGYLLKSYNEYQLSLEEFNKADNFAINLLEKAKLYRAIGDTYCLLNNFEKGKEYLEKSTNVFDKSLGNLNFETIGSYKLLIKFNLDIDNNYFKTFKLFNKNLSNDELVNNLTEVYQIIKNEENKIIIENLFSIIIKNLTEKNIYINIYKIEELVLSKVDNKSSILLILFYYYRHFNKGKAFNLINEAYKNTLNINLLIIMSLNFDIDTFMKVYEKDYNDLKNNIKLDILLNFKEYDKLFNLLINLNDKKYFYSLFKLPINVILNKLYIVENIFEDKKLDILYTNILDFYYLENKSNNIKEIERFLIKQVEVREKYNLENLDKGYSYLGLFYKDQGDLEKSKIYFSKSLELLNIKQDYKQIEKLKLIFNY